MTKGIVLLDPETFAVMWPLREQTVEEKRLNIEKYYQCKVIATHLGSGVYELRTPDNRLYVAEVGEA